MSVAEKRYSGGLALGIGIDMVSIHEIQRIIKCTNDVFVKRTFTPKEQEEGEKEKDPASYYAGRFAVKEAVFKAVAHLLDGGAFDFRLVETMRETDGRPRVVLCDSLKEIFQRAGIDDILVSISNEKDMAIAVAQAVHFPEDKTTFNPEKAAL